MMNETDFSDISAIVTVSLTSDILVNYFRDSADGDKMWHRRSALDSC